MNTRIPTPARRFRRGLLLLFIGLFASGMESKPAAAQVLFPAPYYGAGADSYQVISADVNGDGKPDLVVLNHGVTYQFYNSSSDFGSYSNSYVSILLGNGDGTYKAHIDYACGTGAFSLAVADINGDGKPDILVLNHGGTAEYTSYGAGINTLLNQGNGTFGLPAFTALSANAFTAADVNGDGKPDLILVNYNTVSVMMNKGDGTFLTGISYPTDYNAASVAVADVNGDGKPDIVTANQTAYQAFANGPVYSTVSVLLNKGGGTFGAASNFPAGYTPAAVAIADMDGDGKPDIITSNNGNTKPSVSILRGNGDGTFQVNTDYAAGNITLGLAIADMNGDGRPDIVIGNLFTPPAPMTGNVPNVPMGDGFSVLINQGGGKFTQIDSPAYQRVTAIAVGDANGDGKPDIITLDGGYYSENPIIGRPPVYNSGIGVSVLFGKGDGTAQIAKVYSAGSYAGALAVADVNGDGKPDLISATTSVVSVRFGNGNGTFGPNTDYNVGFISPNPGAIAVADVNGDGFPDLLLASQNDASNSYNSGFVTVLLNKGNGTFGPKTTYPVPNAMTVTVGDVNGDGKTRFGLRLL